MAGFREEQTILIVDDEPTVLESLAAIFRSNGYEVRTALSAEDALETVALWHPDLAIIDVMLPRMNGVDFAVILRTSLPGCRVVLFSGSIYTEPLLEEAAKNGYRFDILPKPVHPVFMLDFISGLLGNGAASQPQC